MLGVIRNDRSRNQVVLAESRILLLGPRLFAKGKRLEEADQVNVLGSYNGADD